MHAAQVTSSGDALFWQPCCRRLARSSCGASSATAWPPRFREHYCPLPRPCRRRKPRLQADLTPAGQEGHCQCKFCSGWARALRPPAASALDRDCRLARHLWGRGLLSVQFLFRLRCMHSKASDTQEMHSFGSAAIKLPPAQNVGGTESET